VQTGLVGSLSRPGGNFTGAAHVNVETAPKRLELVHELIPAEKIVGILLNPTNPVAQSVATAVQPAAGSLGLELKVFYAHSDEEIDRVFASLAEIKIRRPGDRDRSVLHQPGRASAPYRSVRRCPPFINIASSSRPAAS
jgi:ABC transporter substrate binding protein